MEKGGGMSVAISLSTGNARGNEARPARTSGTSTLYGRERGYSSFCFIVRDFLAFSKNWGTR